jgi:RNA polymerase sigma-70 factor (ECF subfamily)
MNLPQRDPVLTVKPCRSLRGSVPLTAEAFADLATAHRPRVLRFATAFLGDRHLAEDAVQEAFKRLFEHRSRYPLKELFGPYLVKTTARLCIDQRRARRSEDRRIATLEAPAVASPAATAETREVADLVAVAVGSLPDRERACFLLTVCEGFSYRETADTLGLSYSEVNNAIHRARLALRASLGKAVGEPQ